MEVAEDVLDLEGTHSLRRQALASPKHYVFILKAKLILIQFRVFFLFFSSKFQNTFLKTSPLIDNPQTHPFIFSLHCK